MLSQPATTDPTAMPDDNLANRDLERRVATADAVVTGRVTVVRVPKIDVSASPNSGFSQRSGNGIQVRFLQSFVGRHGHTSQQCTFGPINDYERADYDPCLIT